MKDGQDTLGRIDTEGSEKELLEVHGQVPSLWTWPLDHASDEDNSACYDNRTSITQRVT